MHVEDLEDMFVPVPPSAEAALAGATVLSATCPEARSPSAGPKITKLLARSASARCLAACTCRGRRGVEHRSGLGRSDDDLRKRPSASGIRGFPKGERRSVADVDLDLLRSRTTPDGHLRRQPPSSPGPVEVVPAHCFPARSAAGTSACCDRWNRFPFVPGDPLRLERDCYEGYNIQVTGLEQRLH